MAGSKPVRRRRRRLFEKRYAYSRASFLAGTFARTHSEVTRVVYSYYSSSVVNTVYLVMNERVLHEGVSIHCGHISDIRRSTKKDMEAGAVALRCVAKKNASRMDMDIMVKKNKFSVVFWGWPKKMNISKSRLFF